MPTNVVAAVLSQSRRRGPRRGRGRRSSPASSTAAWCLHEPPPHDRSAAVGHSTCASTATRSSSNGTKRPVDVGRRRGPAARHRTHRRRPHERARPERHARCHDRADAIDRPDAALRRRRLRRRPAPARPRSSARSAGRTTRSSGQLQLALVHRRGRVGRGDAGGVRHDGRVGVRPLLVRSSAGVVPGAEAPLRRHEVVARGEPRDRRRGRGRGRHRRSARGRARQRRRGLHRPVRRRAGSRLRADPRRHRRHVRARPAPVPAAHRRRTERPTGRPASTAGASPTDPTSRRGANGDVETMEVARDRPRGSTAEPSRSTTSGRGPGRGSAATCRRARRPIRSGTLRPTVTDEEELAEVDDGPRSCSGSSSTPAWPASASRASTAVWGSRRRTSRRCARSSSGFDYPFRLQAPTFSPCAAVLLEFGTDEQKLRHLPAILKGEELWMQLLSEPSGGSDVAGGADDRGARRRRVDPQRLEGLDDRRLVLRLGAVPGPDELGRAEAPRADGVHLPAAPARHRDPPHRDAQRLQGLLPGVHHRRARARHRPHRRRRRGLDDRHPLDVPRADAAQLAVRHVRDGQRRQRSTRACTTSTSPATAAASTTRCAATCWARRYMLELVGEALQHADRRGHRDGHDVRPVGVDRPAVRRVVDDPRARRSPSSSPARPATAWDDDDGAAAEIGNDYLMRQVSTHRRRHDRDGPQRHQRARARHAPRAVARPRHRRSATSPKARRPSSDERTRVSPGHLSVHTVRSSRASSWVAPTRKSPDGSGGIDPRSGGS